MQKPIEELSREEAQTELRRAWGMWREMDDLHDQACDWAIAANSLRLAALEALEEAQAEVERLKSEPCCHRHPDNGSDLAVIPRRESE